MTSTLVTRQVGVGKIMDPVVNNVDECEEEEEEEDEDLEEFEDAAETPEITDNMTIERALEEAQRAIDYFFNNKFIQAKNLMSPYSGSSMYHSLGHAIFLFLEAILTVEPTAISIASKALKHSLRVCNRQRKKNTISESLGKMVRRNNFDQFNENEAHAELCYAECLLLKSMLTFMEDETLSSFIKAGIKIRSCFNSYKDCQQILYKRRWENEQSKLHFESGVKMGVGTFNLMVSMLPSRVIKLLEFIGFSGNKGQGLADLVEGYKLNGIRRILCTMTLLAYNLIVLHVLSHKEGDLELCKEILDEHLAKHPDGVWFLFFQGRLELLQGNLDRSIEYYKKSWHSQDLWPQFHHICYWELLWVHSIRGEWKEAIHYSKILTLESRWSKCLYTYQRCAIMIMMYNQLTSDEKDDLDLLIRNVPKYKQRIAGKSLPMEKFAIKKSERYFNQERTLILPMIELMFMWNIIKVCKTYNICSTLMKLIDKTETQVDAVKKTKMYYYDNRALVYLLKGSCLRHTGNLNQALDYFEKVIQLQKDITEDHYLIPYAIVELALTEWSLGNKSKAILALEDAKKNYTGYSCESRLHFRVHTALTEFKAEMKQANH